MKAVEPQDQAKSFPLYASTKKWGVLVLPNSLTQVEFELLKTQIDNALEIFKETSIIERTPGQQEMMEVE